MPLLRDSHGTLEPHPVLFGAPHAWMTAPKTAGISLDFVAAVRFFVDLVADLRRKAEERRSLDDCLGFVWFEDVCGSLARGLFTLRLIMLRYPKPRSRLGGWIGQVSCGSLHCVVGIVLWV